MQQWTMREARECAAEIEMLRVQWPDGLVAMIADGTRRAVTIEGEAVPETGGSAAHEAAIALRADVARARVRPCRIAIDGSPPTPVSPESGVQIPAEAVREVTLRREEGTLVAVATLDDDVRPVTIAVDATRGVEQARAQLERYGLGGEGGAPVTVDAGAESRPVDIPEAVARVEVVRTAAHAYGLRAQSDEGRAITCDGARSGAKIRYADPREALRAGEALAGRCDIARLRAGGGKSEGVRLDGRWPRGGHKAPGLDDAGLLTVHSVPGGARIEAWPEHRGATRTRETGRAGMLVMESGQGAGEQATLLYNPLAGDAQASAALCAALDAAHSARAQDTRVESTLETVRRRASNGGAQRGGRGRESARAAGARAAGARPERAGRARAGRAAGIGREIGD